MLLALPLLLFTSQAGAPAPDVTDPMTLRVVAFGDSFTSQRRDAKTPWPARLDALLEARYPDLRIEVENAGRPGDTSSSALRRLGRDVLSRDADVVVIQFGVNDSVVDIPRGEDFPAIAPGAYRSNLIDMITTVRGADSDVILLQPSATMWTDALRESHGSYPYGVEDPWGFDRMVESYAEVARRTAGSQRVPLVAVHDADRARGPVATSAWRTDGWHPTDEASAFQAQAVFDALVARIESGDAKARRLSEHAAPSRGWTVPELDLAGDEDRLVVVDRDPGQYLGHPTTYLLDDGRTMLCVYPKGHGKGGICMKRSEDGGLTWSERLPLPESFKTSREVPVIERITSQDGETSNLILWSGLFPARRALSSDDGRTWSELEPVGGDAPWGGIVVMGDHERMADGRTCAWFHDDGRFFGAGGKWSGFTVYQTESIDAGVTWSAPRAISRWPHGHLCEPGVIRRGDRTVLLLRENSRQRNSQFIESTDDGRTWSAPRPLSGALTGDRHQVLELPDGRLFISYRDTGLDSPRWGDWVAWVGTFEDVVSGGQGDLRLRLMDNLVRADCAYPALELLEDGTIVATTYGHWTEGAPPWIASVRIGVDELKSP